MRALIVRLLHRLADLVSLPLQSAWETAMIATRFVLTLLALATIFLPRAAIAEFRTDEFWSSSAADVDGSAKCLARRTGWVFETVGPCDDTDLPKRFRVGDSIEVEGRSFRIGLIKVTRFLEDYEGYGMSFKKGDTQCQIVENEDEYQKFLSESEDTEWIVVGNCRPGRRLQVRRESRH